MEQLQQSINTYKKNLERRTCTVKELAAMLDISEHKARELTKLEGFPVIRFGRNVRILVSELDKFLVEMVGAKLN